MGTTTVVLGGTIDFTATCGCPSPCASCCDVATLCCGAVPKTLFASAAMGGPLCAATIITLAYDGVSAWTGAGVVACGVMGLCGSSVTMSLKLLCLPAGTWQLTSSCDNYVNTVDNNTPSLSNCSPFDLKFNTASPSLGCSTCGSQVLQVEITA